MNILLINHYAGSKIYGMEYRPFYMAREWIKLGHKVTIVAGSHSHLRSKLPQVRGQLCHESVEGIPYIWLKTPRYEGNGLRRVLNIFSFVGQLFRYKSRLARELKPDIVIASSTYPLDVFPASRIAKESGAKLIFEVHDLWPLTPMELGGMSPKHPFIRLLQWGENFAYKNADRVVSMLPNAAEHMISHGMDFNKYGHIPNGFDPEEWQGDQVALPDQHREALAGLKAEGRFLVIYAGSHGLANALETVVDAAEQLKDHRVTFVLVGQGPEKASLESRVRDSGLSNVVFLPTIPKASIPALLDAADVLFIGWHRSSLYRFGISPNKLIDYMMAAKPIIHAVEAGNDSVAEADCGFSIPPESADAISQAVVRMMELTPEARTMMGLRGREYALVHHDYRVLAKQFQDTMYAVANLGSHTQDAQFAVEPLDQLEPIDG